jgi:hypothetical protein
LVYEVAEAAPMFEAEACTCVVAARNSARERGGEELERWTREIFEETKRKARIGEAAKPTPVVKSLKRKFSKPQTLDEKIAGMIKEAAKPPPFSPEAQPSVEPDAEVAPQVKAKPILTPDEAEPDAGAAANEKEDDLGSKLINFCALRIRS